MRAARIRATIRALMASIVVAALILAAFVALRDRRSRAIAIRAATAGYAQARLTREVAEFAVGEYAEGTFQQDLETVLGEIALGEADLARAEDRLAWSDRMRSRGKVSDAQATSDKLALDKARFTAEQARTKREVLLRYTGPKALKELQAEVERSRADELSREAILDMLKGRGTWPF